MANRRFIPAPYRYHRSKRVDPLDWVIIAIALLALAVVCAAFILGVKEAL